MMGQASAVAVVEVKARYVTLSRARGRLMACRWDDEIGRKSLE
jgi:hypothetical protein